MKLNLKKAIPVLTSALLMGSSLAFAISSIDQWKNFGSDVAIVYGAPPASSEDAAGAIEFVKALSAVSQGPSAPVTGEAHLIEAPGNDLNYGESFADIDSALDKTDLPTLLADGTYKETKVTRNDVTYTQKLKFVDNTNVVDLLRAKESPREATTYLFIDDNYALPAFNYSLKFDNPVLYDNTKTLEDFRLTKIKMLGREYTITSVTPTVGDLKGITLMAGALEADQGEYETKTYTFGNKTYEIKVLGVYDNEVPVSVVFEVNGEQTDKMAEGDTYPLADGVEIGVKATLANEGTEGPQPGAPGNDRVQFWLGAEKIEIKDGEEVRVNDKDVDGSVGHVIVDAANHKLLEIGIEYAPEDEVYLKPGESWTDPILGRFKYTFQGLDKKTETITFSSGADDGEIRLKNVKGDDLIIPVTDEADNTNVYPGDMKNSDMVPSGATMTVITEGQTSKGNLLIGSGAANNYFQASTDLDNVNGMKLLVSSDGCEARIVEIARIRESDKTIKFKGWDTEFTYNDAADTEFDLGFTTIKLNIDNSTNKVAAVDTIKCPVKDFKTSLAGYVDLSFDGSAVKFELFNSESTPVSQGAFTIVSSSDDDVEIGTISGTTSSLREKEGSDYYLARDSATPGWGTIWRWNDKDKNDLTIEYPEEEVVAKAYVSEELATIPELSAAAGAPTGGVIAVKDTELTSELKAKNLIVIGGSAINRVAAELLGLSYPTYGSDPAWQNATGVSGEGQAIVKLLDNPYSSGKQALLVAGWEGSDTRKACRAVAEGISGLAGKTSAKLDTSSATAVVIQ